VRKATVAAGGVSGTFARARRGSRHERWGRGSGAKESQRTPTRWHFGLRQIPYPRYNAALASLSRSVTRLTARGLVTRHRGKSWRGTGAGVKLTVVGVPVAARLWEAWLARIAFADHPAGDRERRLDRRGLGRRSAHLPSWGDS
jgi:hypothetical protein